MLGRRSRTGSVSTRQTTRGVTWHVLPRNMSYDLLPEGIYMQHELETGAVLVEPTSRHAYADFRRRPDLHPETGFWPRLVPATLRTRADDGTNDGIVRLRPTHFIHTMTGRIRRQLSAGWSWTLQCMSAMTGTGWRPGCQDTAWSRRQIFDPGWAGNDAVSTTSAVLWPRRRSMKSSSGSLQLRTAKKIGRHITVSTCRAKRFDGLSYSHIHTRVTIYPGYYHMSFFKPLSGRFHSN